MASRVPDSKADSRPWGTSLAMAGALAAGLATGRRGRLVLAAGFAAAAGLNWILSRRAPVLRVTSPRRVEPERVPVAPLRREPLPSDCCDGVEKSGDDGARASVFADVPAVPPVAVAEPVVEEARTADAAVVWEPGRGESVTFGALDSDTVWFGLHLPLDRTPVTVSPALVGLESIPSVPPVGADAVPESARPEVREVSAVAVAPVPAIQPSAPLSPFSGPVLPGAGWHAPNREPGLMVAFALDAAMDGVPPVPDLPAPRKPGERSNFAAPAPSRPQAWGAGEHPGVAVERKKVLETLRSGPHRSVLPCAPVGKVPDRRWAMVATVTAFALVMLAIMLGALPRDGWIRHWHGRSQVARAQAAAPVAGDPASPPGAVPSGS